MKMMNTKKVMGMTFIVTYLIYKPLKLNKIMKNVIEDLEYQMSTDDEPNDKKSDRLKRTYINASESEKKLIDDVFITICGYSLNTLIKNHIRL
jgi:hypothetical protein